MKTYAVKMSSIGNSDFGQDPKKSLSPEKVWFCGSLRECSEHCLMYISLFNMGGGNWSGGQVFQNGIQVARVSFNGRVWDMDDKEIEI